MHLRSSRLQVRRAAAMLLACARSWQTESLLHIYAYFGKGRRHGVAPSSVHLWHDRHLLGPLAALVLSMVVC